MATSVDRCALESKKMDQPTMGVWLAESSGQLYVSVGEKDRGTAVTPEELVSLYRTYHPTFFDAQSVLVWLKKKGVTTFPENFECLVSQNRLCTAGINLTIASLALYWWDDNPPATEAEHAWYVYSLDDSPAYETLKEAGAFSSYLKRLGRIKDFLER